MPYFVLAVAVLAGVLLLARWMTTANPAMLAWLARIIGGVLLVAVPVLLIATGNIQIVLVALPFALPAFFHWRARQKRRRNARGPTPGGTSSVDTGWLRMELDHDTGAMRGVVQRGRFAGRDLKELSLEDLIALHDEVGADPDSVRVLEAYLDRVHGPDWRVEIGGGERREGRRQEGRWQDGPASARGGMSEDEALEILGLAPGASAAAIKDAHRRLMAKLHPDRGGSTYLAAKLNEAKDRLLKGR